MANITKVTKDDILKASLLIIKKEGKDAVNARSIAKLLNCSIQPVYYHFPTMEDLRIAIKKAIRDVYNSYIEKAKNENVYLPFKAVGMAYIKFASYEANYFKILFMGDDDYQFGVNNDIDDNYDYIVSTVMMQFNLRKEQAIRLYENIWVTTHGLAVMIATGFMHPETNKISSILTDALQGQLRLIRGE